MVVVVVVVIMVVACDHGTTKICEVSQTGGHTDTSPSHPIQTPPLTLRRLCTHTLYQVFGRNYARLQGRGCHFCLMFMLHLVFTAELTVALPVTNCGNIREPI